jgi:putative heme-binding domain-containing protein
LAIFASCFLSATLVQAEGAASVAPLMKLLKSGRLPPERVASVVELVCRSGNADDLAEVFELAMKPESEKNHVRMKALSGLADAAFTRKIKPAGDLSGIAKLITPDNLDAHRGIQLMAIRLGASWKENAVVAPLQKVLENSAADAEFQQAALDGLAQLGTPEARKTIEQLAAAGPLTVRYQAIAALVTFNLPQAAKDGAAAVAATTSKHDPGPMLDAFFNQQGGAKALSEALEKTKLPHDAALIALRYMYSIGQTHAELSNVLSKAAGIADDPPPPTAEQLKQLSADVVAKGDAARGEKVFRRADVACLKCHAVSKAGGQVGPDLSPVGANSPVDYVVSSILMPDQAIKEQYLTRVIVTMEGKVYQGIVVDRDDKRVILKEASGKQITIPTADIDEEAEGGSLMPKGLTKFLTRDELLDLARFISELGKPGEYAIRSTPTVQRWRVLKPVPAELASEVPNVEVVRQRLLEANSGPWIPLYSKVVGDLPLDEAAAHSGSAVVYVQGEVNVTRAGDVHIHLNSADQVQTWVDAEPFESRADITLRLEEGAHKLTFRIDTAARKDKHLKVELLKPDGTEAEFEPVGGP